MNDLFRFPHTPHLAWLGSVKPRDDKVLSIKEADSILKDKVIIEEKLDGANLGFSIAENGTLRQQNRGQFLYPPFNGQFERLKQWLTRNEDALFDGLDRGLIVFGEWCAARHSLDYVDLPDWWMLFDIYDCIEEKFWSTCRRNEWAQKFGFNVVPCLSYGNKNKTEIVNRLKVEKSHFRDGPMEGVVIRNESDMWLNSRAKLVRADFSQAIDKHWRKKMIEWNRLKF